MAFMFMPGHFVRRAEFYHQLAQITAAGLGLIGALEQVERNPPGREYRRPIQQILHSLGAGSTFTEALRATPNWLPEFDISLIDAGEQSGRLDASMRLLAGYYADRGRMARQMIGDLAYPVFLLHFAVFLFPFPQLFLTGDFMAYFMRTAGILLPCYAVCALVIYLSQNRHGEGWRRWLERILHPIPVLGTARRYLAVARLSAALEALLSAGINIFEAWPMAAAASGSPSLTRIVGAWPEQLRSGKTPSELVNESSWFPDIFASQYAVGEASGKLDENLKRVESYFREEGTRKLHSLSQWTPRLVYLLVVMMIAYRIVHFWMGYFGQMREVGGF